MFPAILLQGQTVNDSLITGNQGQRRLTELSDSTLAAVSDTTRKDSSKVVSVDSPVKYQSNDSLVFEIDSQKIYLYNQGQVNYQSIELKANYIAFDMSKNDIYAKGLPDSAGVLQGKPSFKDGGETFDSKDMTYNFKTKKGYIEAIKTEQEGGYLHSEETKRLANGNINILHGKYTTCDLDHPHFYLALTKAQSIPGKEIISGPAYVVLEDVPLPIGIPFGFFPSTRTSTSGILIPAYGEENNRGFYLREGGYYFAINDYMDLRVTGDIYSRGTWGANLSSNYRKRYKYSGNFSGRYYTNISGEKGLPTYSKSHDFSVRWSHRQDPKANPTQNFNASVDFSSTSYDKNFSQSIDNYLTNTKRSSISFTKNWPGTPFNFSGSLNHSQNSLDKSVNLNLPKLAFNMSTIYPFRSKNAKGDTKWYENIQLSYSASLDNNIKTVDSLLFTNHVWDNMNNGFQQSIPLSTNIKLLKIFNISPSINYKGVLYTHTIHKHWENNYYDAAMDSTYPKLVTDTISGLKYGHSLYPSFSMSANPKLYGLFQFKKDSRVQAIRHVMSPSASLSLTPDVSSFMPDYYREVQSDTTGRKQVYSIFNDGMYGTPSTRGRSGRVSLGLRNTLEMKMIPRNDTTGEPKKVKILENFDFNTSYDIFKDSLNWSNISFNTGTRLLNNKLSIRVSGNFDPYTYVKNSKGVITRVNEFEFLKTGRIARLTNANISLGSSFRSKAGDKGDENSAAANQQTGMEQDQYAEDNLYPETSLGTGNYVDFSIPWSFNFSYTFNYSRPYDKTQITQTLSFGGDLSLTPKWKIGMRSGYDFTRKKMSTTSMSIHRDLHCWEMNFTAVPFGYRQSYEFRINVKSAILKDLKWNKRKSWYDKL